MRPRHSLLTALVLMIFAQMQAQNLQLSEYMPINALFKDGDDEYFPWVELYNNSDTPVDLAGFMLVTDSAFDAPYNFTTQVLEPGQYKVIWLSGKSKVEHSDQILEEYQDLPLMLVEKEGGLIVDYVQRHSYRVNEAIFRNPEFEGEWIFTSQSAQMTPGLENARPGPWRKVKNHAKFPIVDSGTFGCAVYDGKMWILDFETLLPPHIWTNLVEVWNSEDGINWELVNASPPYKHLAMTVVFNGYMWAFDGDGYRSTDGVTWEKVASGTPTSGEIAEYKGSLWVIRGSSIFTSPDGISWIEATQVPWIPRSDQTLMVHNNTLWAIGGAINYGSFKYEIYFRDVWKSVDGINWELVSYAAPWRGGIWVGYASFDNKMWLVSGYRWFDESTNYGNNDEIWYSEDGVEWKRAILPNTWSARHAPLVWVYNNAMWLAAGYGGGSLARLYNDVWKFSKVPVVTDAVVDSNVRKDGDALNKTYGDGPMTFGLSGFPDNEVTVTADPPGKLLITNTSAEIKQAGTVAVRVSLKDNALYDTHAALTVDVQKKELTVKAPELTREVFTPNPEITLQYNGFAYQDDATLLDEQPEPIVPADEFSPVGTYAITISDAQDDNYELIHEPGALTVEGGEGESIRVFPIPTNTELTLLFVQTVTHADILMMDQMGRVAYRASAENDNHFEMDLTGLSEGIYLLRITTPHESTVRRILIVHSGG